MEVIYGIDSFPRQRVPLVAALGTFDGVHRGHRALIEQAVRRSRELGGRCAVLTFDPHPLQVIAPPPEPFLLTTLEERLALLAGLSVDLTVIIHFDEAFRQIAAEAWIDVLVERIGMAEVICGANYTFGHDRSGTVDLLLRRGGERGFAVRVASPVHVGGTLVGSTLIRRLLRAGEVREAARFLGRWYAVRGEVIQGDRRGTQLGFPTANMPPPEDKVIPTTGIYAALARIEQGTYQAAVSIGTRPTFGPGPLMIEAYLLEFSGDLYGAAAEIHFVERLRDEMTFSSTDALVRQMRDDVEEAQRVLVLSQLQTPPRSSTGMTSRADL